MSYISRRIAVTNEKGEVAEYSDTDFFAIDAPLVVLGEPGSGKYRDGSVCDRWSACALLRDRRDGRSGIRDGSRYVPHFANRQSDGDGSRRTGFQFGEPRG